MEETAPLEPKAPEAGREQWERTAAGVLRKLGRLGEHDPDGAVWDALTTRTLDDLAVPPLGTAPVGQSPYVRGAAPTRVDQGWDIRAWHGDPDPFGSAEAVLADLENGATSLWLRVGASGISLADLPRVLSGVLLDVAPVVLEPGNDPLAAADALLALAEHRGSALAAGSNLGADPVGAALRYGHDLQDVDAVVAGVAGRAAGRGGLRALVVDATAVHDQGASEVQELAYSLAVGAAYLRSLAAAGLGLDEACALVEFRYAATDDQLATIAKLRAARRLWGRVTELSGVEPDSRVQHQHAVTSVPMTSRYDPYVNLLRTTVAAFSAGVGGAQAVTVLPFDVRLGLPDAFSRRLARNTSSLLIAESHVAAVTDPAGGAYVVERHTDDVARAAWAELGRIDTEGGVLGAGLTGLRDRIADVAESRRERVARRTQPLTGLSEFPDLHAEVPARRPYPKGAPVAQAYGADFEAMRDDPAPIAVFLATMGSVSVHTPRATFAANVLAVGGIDVVRAGPTAAIDDVLAAYDGAPVVCLAGADRDYAAWGGDLVAALRSAGARWVVAAGEPVDGADDAVALGGDVVAFLRTVREHLHGADAVVSS